MNNIKEILHSTFKGTFADDAPTIAPYSRDASIFEVTPSFIAEPKSVDDIKAIVRFVSEHKGEDSKLSLTPRAAGTGMAGGALSDSIVLDAKNLNHIKEVTDDYAIVEPGTFYRDLEKETLKRNRIMPSYPASKDICAVGGIVGTNASGEKALVYGSTENHVRALNVVLSDGNEYTLKPLSVTELEEKKSLQTFEGGFYRDMHNLLETNYDAIKAAKPKVSKNAAGYALWNIWDRTTFDLTKLFVGSEGTLGITTEVTFNLVQPKKYSKLLVIFLKDLSTLPEIINKVLEYKPETFESYDDNTFSFAVRFFPDMMKSMKAKGLISLGIRFIPEFFMVLTGGVPKLILLAEFTGDDEQEIEVRAQKAQQDLTHYNIKTKITKSKQDADKYWAVRHESFNLLRHHGGTKRTAPFIDDIIVQPKFLPEFLPRLTAIMEEYELTYTIAGHIGDGNFHIIPLMDFQKKHDRDIILELSHKVFDLTFEFGGSMSGEHNDGIIRTPFLKQMYGEAIYHLFEETKNIFDPKNIFNPGKKVFGKGTDYLKEHIDRKVKK